MFRPAFSLLSPGGARGRLNVLIFHRVLAEPDALFPGEMHAASFDAVCGWLRRWFEVLPLTAAVQRLRKRELPPRALTITFDDGYADNHDVALPILQRHGLNATFFVATSFCDGGRMWNDTLIEAVRGARVPALAVGDLLPLLPVPLPLYGVEERRRAIDALIRAAKYLSPARRQALVDEVAARSKAALPSTLMMTRDQVRALHRHGMEIGAHTVNHPILATLGDDAAREEIAGSRATLEDWTQAPVRSFAYPNGRPGDDYSPANVATVRSLGFDAAVSTAWGVADADTDPFQIPRFTPWDRSKARFGLRLLRQLASSR